MATGMPGIVPDDWSTKITKINKNTLFCRVFFVYNLKINKTSFVIPAFAGMTKVTS